MPSRQIRTTLSQSNQEFSRWVLCSKTWYRPYSTGLFCSAISSIQHTEPANEKADLRHTSKIRRTRPLHSPLLRGQCSGHISASHSTGNAYTHTHTHALSLPCIYICASSCTLKSWKGNFKHYAQWFVRLSWSKYLPNVQTTDFRCETNRCHEWNE